jgi:hypothetical protein
MNADELKKAWQTQPSQARLTLDADLILKEVRRNHQAFLSMIFWRDAREISVALAMIPFWFYIGIKESLPWTWYLAVPALVWIAGFMLVDRVRNRKRESPPTAPLAMHIETSLAQVEHQIWLLRNVLWWYLLPPGIAILTFFAQVAWIVRGCGWIAFLIGAGLVAVEALILGGVYWLNQRAARNELEPRRQELLALRDGIGSTHDT